MHMSVRGESEAESVTFETELFGNIWEVERHVWEVAFGDMVFAEEIRIF